MISARSAKSGVLLILAQMAVLELGNFAGQALQECGPAPSEPVPVRCVALALQSGLQVKQAFARFHQGQQLLVRGIVRLALAPR